MVMDIKSSRHMTKDVSKFTSLKYKDKGTISSGNNDKLKLIGLGT